MLTIRLTTKASRQLAVLTKVDQLKVWTKIKAYAANPQSQTNNVKRLRGEAFLRLRVGDYRVIFTNNRAVMDVYKIGHRREIYE